MSHHRSFLFSLVFSLTFFAGSLDLEAKKQFVIGQIKGQEIVSRVPKMKTLLLRRAIVRSTLYGAGIIGGIFLMNYAMKAQLNGLNAMKAGQYDEAVRINHYNERTDNGTNPNPNVFKRLWSWTKSVPASTGSIFKQLVPPFIAQVIINVGWEKIKAMLFDPVQDESLQWFYNEKTHLKNCFAVLKMHAASLDPESFYLDYKTNQMGHQLALKEFMQEVYDVVGQKDDFITSFLPGIVKKHMRKSRYLEQLADDALIIEGLKQGQQFIADDQSQNAQNYRKFCRQTVHTFIMRLKFDIEKTLAFMIGRYGVITINSSSVQQIITLTNQYLADVEKLLNLSDEELLVASREKRGLFTKTFEFHKYLDDSLKTLKAYLLWA